VKLTKAVNGFTYLPNKLHRSHSTTQAGLACDRQLVISFVMCDVSNHVSKHMRSMVTCVIEDCASLCSDSMFNVTRCLVGKVVFKQFREYNIVSH
jgi:hypothetical protein